MKTGYDLVDIDGTHTRWSVWSPGKLNHDPDWASEKSLNSLELLTYLKFAAHITGDEKYEKEYRRLIDKEGYLDNASHLNSKNPAWQIYFDRTLEGYILPILIRYEKDPVLAGFYRKLANEWMSQQSAGENLINNFSYAFATGKPVNVPQSMDFLRDAPLDLVDWHVDHTIREDVKLIRKPILEEIQVAELPPASERSTVRWDKNPWAAVQGNPTQVREPVFWLWPYWMARYLDIIRPGTVRIGICADAHLGTMHDSESRLGAFLDEMKKTRPDFMIELGDFAEASDSGFFRAWDACPVKSYHVIGNHETDGGHTLSEALSAREMTGSYYSFDSKGYHFIVLDGNEKSKSGKKGYSQYIGEKQLDWFRKELSSAAGPVIVFSHQPLIIRQGAVESYGVENAETVSSVIRDHNRTRPDSRVLACINGHNHWDYAEKVEGVWYISITSMSYDWLGEDYTEIRYSSKVDSMFKWIKYTAPFRDPLFTTIEISRSGFIRIAGKSSEWVGSSPFDLGYPGRMKQYLRPGISERSLMTD
jgi:predicted phosphodiesterase